MVVDNRAKDLQILINGFDYSKGLDRLSIGPESYGSRGLVRKRGSLVIKAVIGLGKTLDPRDNSDFMPGNEVLIDWDGTTHPIGGKLLILAVPSVEVLEGNLSPLLAQNLQITLQIGCALTYYATLAPDNDFSDVTLGTPKNGSAVCVGLLQAAGIPDIGIGGFANSFTYPVQKQGGGWVGQAADVAYGSGSNGSPTILYCDETNTVRSKIVDLDASALVELSVDQNLVDYQWEADPEPPPGTVQAIGTRKEVIESDICVAFVSVNEGVETTTVTCNYENWPFTKLNFGGREVAINADKGQYQTAIRRENLSGQFVETQRLDTFQRYSDADSLEAITKLGTTLKQNISSNATPPGEEFQTVPYLIEEEFYGFENNQISVIQNRNEQARVTINPSEADTPFDLTQHTIQVSNWEQQGNYWGEIQTVRRARGLIDQLTDPEQIYDLAIDPRSTTIISNAGGAQPPRIETWEGLFREESYGVSEEVFFTSSEQRLQVQLPYVFSVSQARNIARKEGEIAWGRQYSYRMVCDPNFFVNITEPLFILKINEPITLKSRIYLVDSFRWVHTKSTTVVNLIGIFLGDTTGTARESNFPAPAAETPFGGDVPDIPPQYAGQVSYISGGVPQAGLLPPAPIAEFS